jgi:uncharacterized caspase-like protein
MSYGLRLVTVLVCALVSLQADPVHAERKVALVIGNSLYGHHAALPNVPNDAAAMAALLKGAGFASVVIRPNLSIAGLRGALRDFAGEVATADVAVLFYAGHGIEVGGTNYLIPVDARLATDYDVKDETVELDRVLEAMAPAKRLRLVLLDACRENPFVKGMKRTVAGRDVGRGLSRFEPPVGNTLIAFATKPNAIALDGKGPNSPFTAALVKHLGTPGHDVRLALGDVRDDVLASTGGKQEPYLAGSLGSGIFAIVGSALATLPQGQLSDAERAWALAKNTNSIAVLEAFVRRFGDTYYGDLAKMRLEELKAAEVAGAEAARKKAEDDARAKAEEAERQRLAVQVQVEEERKRKEAEEARIEAEARLPAIRKIGDRLKGAVFLWPQRGKIGAEDFATDVHIKFLGGLDVRVKVHFLRYRADPSLDGKVVFETLKLSYIRNDHGKNRFWLYGAVELSADEKKIVGVLDGIQISKSTVWKRVDPRTVGLW